MSITSFGLLYRCEVKRATNCFNLCRNNITLQVEHNVARITTHSWDLLSNTFPCCKLPQDIATSRSHFYSSQHFPATCDAEFVAQQVARAGSNTCSITPKLATLLRHKLKQFVALITSNFRVSTDVIKYKLHCFARTHLPWSNSIFTNYMACTL